MKHFSNAVLGPVLLSGSWPIPSLLSDSLLNQRAVGESAWSQRTVRDPALIPLLLSDCVLSLRRLSGFGLISLPLPSSAESQKAAGDPQYSNEGISAASSCSLVLD